MHPSPPADAQHCTGSWSAATFGALDFAQSSLTQMRQSLDTGHVPAGLGDTYGVVADGARSPAYLRTFVQGCACTTGLAGGGACPCGVSSLAAAGTHPLHGCHTALGAAATALGVLGMYSGLRVLRSSQQALHALKGVAAQVARRQDAAQLWRTQVQRVPDLPQAQLAAQQAWQGWDQAAAQLQQSQREQQHHRWVPGMVQLGAAAAATLGATPILVPGWVAPAWAAAAGLLGTALFALYGLLMAGKHAAGWLQDRTLRVKAAGDTAFSAAFAHYMAQRQKAQGKTALSWLALGAAGVLGTLVGSGTLAFAGASTMVAGAALAAAALAMYYNSRSRFVPHVPLSPHMASADLHTAAQRATTWRHVQAQHRAISQAVATMLAEQGCLLRLRAAAERQFAAQCGPRANQVLAARLQQLYGATTVQEKAQRQRFVQAQLRAVGVWLAEEEALWRSRHADQLQALQAGLQEMHGILLPRCATRRGRAQARLAPGHPQAATLTEAALDLAEQAQRAQQVARRLTQLGAMRQQAATLEPRLCPADGAAPAAAIQARWVALRLALLQHSGALGDVVAPTLLQRAPELFDRLPAAQALPLDHVCLRPDRAEALGAALADTLDGGFVRAFFHPRRLEAELDCLMDSARQARLQPAPVALATRCDAPAANLGKTCCG